MTDEIPEGVIRTEPSADLAEVVSSCNRFALDVFGETAGAPGNLFFSPSSISMALAMAWAGASGETAVEVRRVLHATLLEERFHEGFRELRTSTKTGGVELRMANRLWGQQGYQFLSDFLQRTERCYGSRLAPVDFAAAAESACRQINEWVADQTAQRITDLVSPHALPALTRLVLTNAIYFKGSWEDEFEEELTKSEPFWTGPGSSLPAMLMHQSGHFRYGEFDGLQVLELPYRSRQFGWEPPPMGDPVGLERLVQVGEGSDFVLSVLLPRQFDGLQDIESRLNRTSLQEWTSLRFCLVDVAFPRFRIEASLSLGGTLQSLGMRRAFSAKEADFSRMSDDPEGLYIGAAIHRAFVDVNEKGTEAAAATALAMGAGCAAEPEEPKVFRADHPFLFLIRDRKTRLIHFIGRVVQPECPA